MLRAPGSFTSGEIEAVFGVGPGQFPMQNWEEFKRRGIHIYAQVTHNSYTQVSSETGIPGLIFFLITLLFAIFQLGVIRRQGGLL